MKRVGVWRGGARRWTVLGLPLVALCLLLAVRGGGAVRAAGITVTYAAGWNLVGGPDGTVFNGAGNSYTLGAGDADYVTNPGSTPIAGGKGYWMYFAAETKVTLNGAGLSSVRVGAPANQYVMIGNPSGTQAATVDGADQVLAYDTAAGRYSAVTQLAVGQGAWALSSAGGSITITATGPAQPLPADTSVALPTPQAQVTPAASTAGSEAPGPCTLGPLCGALAVKLTVDPSQTTVNSSTDGDLVVVATVYSAGRPVADATIRICVMVGPFDAGCTRAHPLYIRTQFGLDLQTPPLPVGTVISIHAIAMYMGVTGTGDLTYTVNQ